MENFLKAVEDLFETLIFRSRWLLAPLYAGLVLGLILLFLKFTQEFVHEAPKVFESSEAELILMLLSLVDMVLVGNLLLMVIFTGYENFVSKIDVSTHTDRPPWMGKVDFSGLKLRMIASIVAISSIQLLKGFLNVKDISNRDLSWMVGIHVTFVVSGVLLAFMTRLEGSELGGGPAKEEAES